MSPLPFLSLLFIGASLAIPAAAPALTQKPGEAIGRTIIPARLRGNSGMTLQWIDWDRRGTVDLRQPDRTIS